MRGGASRPTASGDERSAAGRAGVGACLPESPCGNERAPGPVNPSLRAATKELRACEPEPPCGNERAQGLRTRASVRQRKGLRFLQNRRPCARYLCRILVAFSRGWSGTRGLRIPSAVSARRDAPEGGRKVGRGGVPPGVAPDFTPGCRAAAGPAPLRRRRCGWLPPARAPRASRSRRAPRWTRYPWRRPPRCRNGGRPPSPPARGR